MNEPNAVEQRVHRLARLLDASIPIPGTAWRIGLDPILGLIPGVGDLLGLLLSLLIVEHARAARAPAPLILQMLANLAIDAGVGAFPLLGDLLDFGWKANLRNAELFSGWLRNPAATRQRSRAWIAAVAVGLTLLLAGLIGGAIWIGTWLRDFLW